MLNIGIDLGTTNSLIAIFEDTGARLFRNTLGSFLTPSVVSLDGDEIIVGQAAKDRLVSHPKDTVANFKRMMGSRAQSKLGRRSFLPEELSALILRKLKEDAETELGSGFGNVVISVPAYFNNQQRKATIDAASLAGLSVDRLVNEPTAAALAFGVADKTEGTFLVFDLGGGTFDVSILDRYEDVLEVKATTGDTRLGGEDFTDVLERLIRKQASLGTVDISPVTQAAIRRQAEDAKHVLTKQNSADFQFQIGGETRQGSITRETFEMECATLLKRIRQPVERAVRDSNLRPEAFDSIILVGGATRMPMIRSLVARMFGKLPLITHDPDTTVALGAATQSGLIVRQGPLKDVVMTDVCPHTLGIATLDDPDSSLSRTHVSPIIERNAVVPLSRAEIYGTVRDKQKILAVEVYQGENLRPENNVHIGTINVPVPPRKAGQETVEVRFTYDVNGVLQVEATVLSTKVTLSRIFKNETGLSESELNSRFAALEKLKLHPRNQDENKALVARAERLYEEALGDERDEIRRVIAAFEEEISDQKMRNPDACRKHYSQLLDTLEAGQT
jgi:molecular chaperone HscC